MLLVAIVQRATHNTDGINETTKRKHTPMKCEAKNNEKKQNQQHTHKVQVKYIWNMVDTPNRDDTSMKLSHSVDPSAIDECAPPPPPRACMCRMYDWRWATAHNTTQSVLR